MTTPDHPSVVCTREAIAKMCWTFVSHPPNSTDLTRSYFCLLAPWRMYSGEPFCGRWRADTQSVWRSPTLQQGALGDGHTAPHADFEKSVVIVKEFFCEYWSQIFKGCTHHVCKFLCNFNYIFLCKRIGGITFVLAFVETRKMCKMK